MSLHHPPPWGRGLRAKGRGFTGRLVGTDRQPVIQLVWGGEAGGTWPEAHWSEAAAQELADVWVFAGCQHPGLPLEGIQVHIGSLRQHFHGHLCHSSRKALYTCTKLLYLETTSSRRISNQDHTRIEMLVIIWPASLYKCPRHCASAVFTQPL